MGVSLGRRAGLVFALISGEDGALLDVIAAKLGITDVYPGCKDKAAAPFGISPQGTSLTSMRFVSSVTTSTTSPRWGSAVSP